MAKYRQVTGNVTWAKFTLEPEFAQRQRRRTGARLRGKHYEKRALAHLRAEYGPRVMCSPWIQYMDESGKHFCQPDALLFNVEKGSITCIEVKYQHTQDAWLQLRRLYIPILERLFATPDRLWHFPVVEMVKWFDPQVAFPEKITMAAVVHLASPRDFNVHIWNP